MKRGILALLLLCVPVKLYAQVATPVITPAPGQFQNLVTVTITDATPGAIIYYTTDGSTPSISSAVYAAPLLLTSTATVRAIAYVSPISGMVSSAFAVVSCLNGGTTWSASSPIGLQSASVRVSFDATPGVAAMDGVAGLSTVPAAYYSDLAAIVRFNPSGFIDARNGALYASVAPVP